MTGSCARCGFVWDESARSDQRLLEVLLPDGLRMVVCGHCHVPGEVIVSKVAA